MTTLVIGGDHIDAIRRELAEHGLRDIEHWGGRKPADARRRAIPSRTRLVIFLTDQLSHAMLLSARGEASRLGLPMVYSKRSPLQLRRKLAAMRESAKQMAEQGRCWWLIQCSKLMSK